MALTVMGIAAIASAATKGIMGGMSRNADIIAANERYGSDKADIEHRVANTITAGQEAMSSALTAANVSKAQVDLGEQQTQADQEIQAAVSGATGGSVDQASQEAERNANFARSNIELSLEDTQERIRTQTSDSIMSDTSRLSDGPDSRMGRAGLQGALSGLFTYGALQL